MYIVKLQAQNNILNKTIITQFSIIGMFRNLQTSQTLKLTSWQSLLDQAGVRKTIADGEFVSLYDQKHIERPTKSLFYVLLFWRLVKKEERGLTSNFALN